MNVGREEGSRREWKNRKAVGERVAGPKGQKNSRKEGRGTVVWRKEERKIQ